MCLFSIVGMHRYWNIWNAIVLFDVNERSGLKHIGRVTNICILQLNYDGVYLRCVET